MNHTTSYVSPAERRHLSRRTLPTFMHPKSWKPIEPGALHAQRLMESWFPTDIRPLAADRRDVIDRRKDAIRLKPASHWPKRVAWIMGAVLLCGAGFSFLRYNTPRQLAAIPATHYNTVHAQYQWLGFHRFPPSLEWPAANGAQKVFPT